MKNIKTKKTLAAIGAVMALGLAGQSQATPNVDPIYDPSAGYGQFNEDMAIFCAIQPGATAPAVSQPFLDPDPTWNCGDPTRTYNAIPLIPV